MRQCACWGRYHSTTLLLLNRRIPLWSAPHLQKAFENIDACCYRSLNLIFVHVFFFVFPLFASNSSAKLDYGLISSCFELAYLFLACICFLVVKFQFDQIALPSVTNQVGIMKRLLFERTP
ncbi:hypothetical protein KP509_39G011400 [Ceratopteris richardii]|uniref:Uncharacterized protein n=1 Tax=Ceratopteris richardii TaxID=49495 RepID=A0A8T2PYS6_CERRI|nr:hypothetical protein KP509_39G011400 [Ceratopteris richardii]